MRFLFFALCAASAAANAANAPVWATVPASVKARNLDSFNLPTMPTEDSVRLIGQGPVADVGAPLPFPVFSVNIGVSDSYAVPRESSSISEGRSVPNEVLWPDANGRIAQPVPGSEASGQKEVRNPWEVRIHPKSVVKDVIFTCGGIISGGEGGGVAFLNGRIVKAGSTLEGFTVTKVDPGAIVVRRNRISYALPLGRRVIVAVDL
jgi:hypothetical protein